MTKDDYEQSSLLSTMQHHQSLHKTASQDSDMESGSSLTQLNDEDDDGWMVKDSTKGRARSKDYRFTLTIPQTSFRTHLAYGATIFALFFIAVTLLRMAFWRAPPPPPSRSIATTTMVIPHNYRIQASVFYGRRAYVDILDCYLQRNLKKNGGWLDEVNFLIHTDDEEDVAWVEELISQHPEFTASYVVDWKWAQIWKRHMSRSDTIYIKMDDDVLWFSDDAIPHVVTTLLSNPSSLAVSANAINSPEGNWLHYHQDAIHPFLPTPFNTSVNHSNSLTEWRTSSMLSYPTHLADRYPGWNFSTGVNSIGLEWSRMERTSRNLHKTPIALGTYDPFGPAWTSWAIAAQQHYSLLANLEDHTLDRYYISDRPWNMQYGRYSINFVAIKGSTVQVLDIHGDDESDLTEAMPKKLGKPFLLETRALVSHFSFGPQASGILGTDLLGRYRGFANEMVCESGNKKFPWSGFE